MCEAHAYLITDGKEERILESVDQVELNGDEATLVNIFGEQKTIKATFKRYDNQAGKIVFEPLA
jgi:predicted RNA-binding protein